MDNLSQRSAVEVLDDHLRLASENDLEADLARNVAEDIVVLTARGVFHGHPGVRGLARQLMDEVPSGEWRYRQRLVEGRVAFLEWTVDSGPFRVCDGADSYLIEDGKIKAQTIHYTVSDEQGRVLIRADGTRPPPE
jgi:SnoaL-like domain